MRQYPDYEYIVGDVRDATRVDWAMRGVDVVFHAAALKHVPLTERHPYEAFQTNVMGSQNVADAAERHGVEAMVALSTDKAVKPVNAMGTSKAMMEKLICSRNQLPTSTRFCCTRYGNVLGSRGSVLPLFAEQARSGTPLTITHPQMTRFLMDLDESVELVFHALLQAKGGEIYVRKAPAATVDLLADAVLKHLGGKGKRIVGVRPGEKMHEVLLSEYELPRAIEQETFYEVQPEYRHHTAVESHSAGEEYTSANTTQLTNVDDVVALIKPLAFSQETS